MEIQGSRSVFVDSSAWFAVFDSRVIEHEIANRAMRECAAERITLVTTNFIVAETHALTLSRLGSQRAMVILDRLDQGAAQIVRVEPEDERHARDIIHQYADKDFSLTDAISFAVMDRLGITTAFAFDRHFGQYGLMTLPSDSS